MVSLERLIKQRHDSPIIVLDSDGVGFDGSRIRQKYLQDCARRLGINADECLGLEKRVRQSFNDHGLGFNRNADVLRTAVEISVSGIPYEHFEESLQKCFSGVRILSSKKYIEFLKEWEKRLREWDISPGQKTHERMMNELIRVLAQYSNEGYPFQTTTLLTDIVFTYYLRVPLDTELPLDTKERKKFYELVTAAGIDLEDYDFHPKDRLHNFPEYLRRINLHEKLFNVIGAITGEPVGGNAEAITESFKKLHKVGLIIISTFSDPYMQGEAYHRMAIKAKCAETDFHGLSYGDLGEKGEENRASGLYSWKDGDEKILFPILGVDPLMILASTKGDHITEIRKISPDARLHVITDRYLDIKTWRQKAAGRISLQVLVGGEKHPDCESYASLPEAAECMYLEPEEKARMGVLVPIEGIVEGYPTSPKQYEHWTNIPLVISDGRQITVCYRGNGVIRQLRPKQKVTIFIPSAAKEALDTGKLEGPLRTLYLNTATNRFNATS